MTRDSLSSIFPLPLSPFEQFTLLDDRPAYPMTFFFHWFVTGSVDLDAFSLAVAQAVGRHPLLRCRIETQKRQSVWVLSDHAPRIKVVPHGTPLWKQNGDYLDLTKETGLRIWIRPSSDRAEIIYQFHHACCDGIGTGQFLGDVAISYARRTSPNGLQPELESLDHQRLLTRHHVLKRRFIAEPPSRMRRMRGKFREFVKFFRQQPAPLATMQSADGSATANAEGVGEPNILNHWLDRQTTLDLRAVARRVDASLNDLIVRDLLVTMRCWNQEHSNEPDNRDLRVLIPTNLRADGDQFLPATNVLGYAFITRSAQEIENPDALLIGVRDSTRAILRYKLGWLFLDAITTLLRIRRILPVGSALLGRSCFATAIQSHMGKGVQRFGRRLAVEGQVRQTAPQGSLGIGMGNLVIDQILATPPVRPSTHAAIGTYTFSRRLIINLRCDPNQFTPADAQQLLDRFVERLKETGAS